MTAAASGRRLALLLAVFWLLLSGHYTVLLLVLGALSIVLVVVLVGRMDAADGTRTPVRMSVRAPRYAGWLAGQVLMSSLAVVRQVWSPRLAPHPAVGVTPVDDLSEAGTVVFANSITLTPGTLSLQVDDGGIEVHALRRSDLDVLRSGAMLDRVRQLEGR